MRSVVIAEAVFFLTFFFYDDDDEPTAQATGSAPRYMIQGRRSRRVHGSIVQKPFSSATAKTQN